MLKPYMTQQLLTNSFVHSRETRQANDIHLTSIQMTIQHQSFKSKLASSWNNLPNSMKNKHFLSVHSLNKALKNYYISKYSSQCEDVNFK